LETLINNKVWYYDPCKKNSCREFGRRIASLLTEADASKKDVIIICIGSDRATGDCLGPLVGDKLVQNTRRYIVYGTLDNPVHAKNLADTIDDIRSKYCDPFIIAIDASLGVRKHVGYVTIGTGSLSPGIGVDKELPKVGDIHITGIVNFTGMLNQMLLQTTRLSHVMRLADFICKGFQYFV